MFNIDVGSNHVNVITKDDMRAAANAAQEEAANTGGFQLPGVLFRQGKRYCISTAIPVRRVRTRLEVNAAAKRGSVKDVLTVTNRPIMPDHVSNIADYIDENVGGSYILPPMTLNVQHPISVYLPGFAAQGAFGSCFVVIPETARLSVTDGGHRTSAIIKAATEMGGDKLAEFDQDAVSVMITLESDMVKVHQDFADCSKTKPLPKSQLAAYDRRNPANGMVLELIDQCALFSDKIDSTSKTLSKTSTFLFLTNQVRQLVKELLVGDYAMADDQFEHKAKELLVNKDSKQFADELARFAQFVNIVTSANPLLGEIAALPPGVPRNIIKDKRAEGWINLTATGLVITGRIGFELFRDQVPNWESYADLLGKLDWSRNSLLWRGNIVRGPRLSTQRAPVKFAVEHVRRAIGLPPNHKLDDELAAAESEAISAPEQDTAPTSPPIQPNTLTSAPAFDHV